MNKLKLFAAAAVALLLGLVALLRPNSGKRVAGYLEKRRKAEERAKAKADESLVKLKDDVNQANKGIADDSSRPADTFNRYSRR